MEKRVPVSVGDQVYTSEGASAFGSVRYVAAHELVLGIENHGDVTVPASAVKAVHDGKVIVDGAQLPPELRRAIRRAHAAETD